MSATSHRQLAASTGRRGEERSDLLARGLLALALALGLVHFWRLGDWSLWLDEALTLADARSPLERSNPLGYLVFGRFYDLFHPRPSELWLRFPAALFGWLSIALAGWGLRPLVGRRGAATAALFLASSSWHLYWSQNARFYTLALCLSLAGGALVLRSLLAGRTPGVLLGVAGIAIAALVHPSSALLFGAILVAPWLARLATGLPSEARHRAAWTALLLVGLLSLALGAGWILRVWHVWAVRTGAPSTRHFLLSSGFLATPLLGLAFLAGAWRALRSQSAPAVMALAVFAIGATIALAASLRTRVSAQYAFVLLPWLAAGGGFLLEDARGSPRRSRAVLALVALVCLPMWIDGALYFHSRNGDRPRWREAYRYVFESRGEGDLVFGMEAPVGEYYLDPLKTDLRDWRLVTWLDGYRARVPAAWARYPRRAWFIVNLEQLQDWSAPEREAMLATLEQDCRLVRSFPIPYTPRDLAVHVYVRP